MINIFLKPIFMACQNCNKISFVTGWVNRFANAGDTAVEIAGNTAYRVRRFLSICGFLLTPFWSLFML